MPAIWLSGRNKINIMTAFFTITYLVLLASVKFFLVPFISINLYGFGFFTAVFINTLGGIIGCTFFFKLAYRIVQWNLKRRNKKIKNGTAKPKKVFTRTNRFIVSTKKTMGIYGLALITPAIISIPIGTIIAAKYYHLVPKKMLSLLYLSSFLWALALSGIAIIFS